MKQSIIFAAIELYLLQNSIMEISEILSLNIYIVEKIIDNFINNDNHIIIESKLNKINDNQL